ncbi:hypothetical protein [Streptomyces sp. V4I2]|nr:hypothetical protein [Streptomyces sp. V4I2]MDQ1042294.1 SOS-response transcriptional repressor LexA [Streptomyces sp. V4I2]
MRRVATCAPLLAEELVEAVYSLPHQVVSDGDLFALSSACCYRDR